MQASDWIATVALAISLVSMAIVLNQHLRDKYKLRCSAFVLTTFGSDEETFKIGVIVVNDGRRPVSITDIYFERVLEDDGQPSTYPIRKSIHGGRPDEIHALELMENQTKQIMSEKYSLQEMINLSPVIDVYVRDSRGKIYRLPVHNDAYEWLATDDH